MNELNNKNSEFDNLVENAFDFLERSLKQIEEEPKYSVINFYSAIELFFKARLLKEHWSLIISKPSEANKIKFHNGDFISVNLKECVKRLKNICNENIDKKWVDILNDIKNHRNKLVHFFHKVNGKDSDKIIKNLMTEQFLGWCVIQNLLTCKWRGYFSKYQDRIKEINSFLNKHEQFLKTKYTANKPGIEERINKGKVFKECLFCNYKASQQIKTEYFYAYYACNVCNNQEKMLHIKCPECNNYTDTEFDNIEGIKCHHCSNKLNKQILLDEYRVEEYDENSCTIIGCSSCGGTNIIENYNEEYLCLDCNEDYKSEQPCEYCYNFSLGLVSELSYLYGCSFCDGYTGQIKK